MKTNDVNDRILMNMAINNTEQEEMELIRAMPKAFMERALQRYKTYKKLHEGEEP